MCGIVKGNPPVGGTHQRFCIYDIQLCDLLMHNFVSSSHDQNPVKQCVNMPMPTSQRGTLIYKITLVLIIILFSVESGMCFRDI